MVFTFTRSLSCSVNFQSRNSMRLTALSVVRACVLVAQHSQRSRCDPRRPAGRGKHFGRIVPVQEVVACRRSGSGTLACSM